MNMYKPTSKYVFRSLVHFSIVSRREFVKLILIMSKDKNQYLVKYINEYIIGTYIDTYIFVYRDRYK